MRILIILKIILIFIALTILTQIGGVVYLISFSFHRFIHNRIERTGFQRLAKFGVFLVLYCLATFAVVPLLAKPFGRVALPISGCQTLKPHNFFTYFLNRHYVRPELKKSAIDLSVQMDAQFPGTITHYLDANFPFFNGFPLFPHLSHSDGKKLDLSFFYTDQSTGNPTDKTPSIIGYGVCEGPLPTEKNTAGDCAARGFWQYSFLEYIVPQGRKNRFTFDEVRTKALVLLCTQQKSIGKLFIEPHLKSRMHLSSDKIRFHGCQAVRHDDHVHIQLR